MKDTDARRLTHDQLTDLRRRGVAAVQAGQSPEQVARWLREEYPKIEALAKARKVVIWFGDEAGSPSSSSLPAEITGPCSVLLPCTINRLRRLTYR